VDAVVHFVGVFFGLIGAIVLMLSSIGGLPFRDIAGLGVYSLGLIGMFTASASYHLVRRPSLKEWFRRVDHAVIFVMIAGSYTPFALKIGGDTGTLILAAVWGIALLGVDQVPLLVHLDRIDALVSPTIPVRLDRPPEALVDGADAIVDDVGEAQQQRELQPARLEVVDQRMQVDACVALRVGPDRDVPGGVDAEVGLAPPRHLVDLRAPLDGPAGVRLARTHGLRLHPGHHVRSLDRPRLRINGRR
jgi:hypothetical protein